MPALTAHLRDPDTHARLVFHPGCPICRSERLSGTLSPAPLVSQRTRAALATGVLAASTISPAATFAREPDTAQDGAADATQPVGGDGTHQPGFAPDRGAGDQPHNAGNSAPADEPASDTASPDDEPIVDPDAGPVAQDPRGQPAPPPPSPSAPAAPAAPAVGAAGGAGTGTPAPASALASTIIASTAASARPALTTRIRARKRTTTAQVRANATPQPAAVTAVPSPAPTVATPPADHANPAHTVKAGESLWSIAGDHLGPGAGPAQIAREVHRLWQLNTDRIGTGDPDLLMIGTRLRLR